MTVILSSKKSRPRWGPFRGTNIDHQRFKSIACALLGALLGGCATQATLTVYTVPAGGYVSEVGGTIAGMAPITLRYEPSQLRQLTDAEGCFIVKGMESRWMSGAMTTLPLVQLCGQATGSYNVTLTRNATAPDLDKDLQFALQLRNSAAQQQSAHAASMASIAAVLQSITPNNRPSSFGGTAAGVGFLKRQYQSGLNRICIYDRVGSEVAVTVGSAELCPLSLQ